VLNEENNEKHKNLIISLKTKLDNTNIENYNLKQQNEKLLEDKIINDYEISKLNKSVKELNKNLEIINKKRQDAKKEVIILAETITKLEDKINQKK